MKNISYVINGVLAIAIIVLFILFFTSKSEITKDEAVLKHQSSDSLPTLPVAYVNVDSLLHNYNFAKDMTDLLMRKFNTSNNTMTQKQKHFEKEYAEFQRKLRNNAFISEERAQEEAERLGKLERELQQMGQRMQNDLAAEQQKVNGQISDSVSTCLKIYNEKAKYELIFSNTSLDNILIARDAYDITAEVLVMLNNRYKPESTSK